MGNLEALAVFARSPLDRERWWGRSEIKPGSHTMTFLQRKAEDVWRVFYTTPRAEKKCESRLQDSGIEVLLPKRIVIRQWADRKKKIIEPLFPNYIFARVDEALRLRVLQTDGIVRTVSFGSEFAIISEEEIKNLILTQNDPSRLELFGTPLPPKGRKVIIEEGPMKGLRGEIISHRGKTHVIVSVSSIRQYVRINVPAAWIRVLSDEPLRTS